MSHRPLWERRPPRSPIENSFSFFNAAFGPVRWTCADPLSSSSSTFTSPLLWTLWSNSCLRSSSFLVCFLLDSDRKSEFPACVWSCFLPLQPPATRWSLPNIPGRGFSSLCFLSFPISQSAVEIRFHSNAGTREQPRDAAISTPSSQFPVRSQSVPTSFPACSHSDPSLFPACSLCLALTGRRSLFCAGYVLKSLSWF